MRASEAVPLKHLAGINERALTDNTDPDRQIRYIDISAVGRGALVAEPQTMRFEDAPSRARRLVRDSDTIVSTVRTYLRAVWPVQGDTTDLIASTGFAVLSPREIDPGYFSWWIRSDVFIEEVVARSVGVSYPAINALDLGELRVRVPSHEEQRAIADYLDTETARIDALITKKRRMIELLEQRRSIEIETLVRAAASAKELPLKHAVRDVTVGIVITPAAWYADDGVPAVRGVNVSPGQIDMNDCVYLTDEGHLINRKSTIRSGDVLVVRTGQAGAAAVVPDELDGTNCIDLLLIRPSQRVAPRFLEYVLNSDWTMKHIEKHSVGTIQSHFNVGALRQLPMPLPTLEEQNAVVHELDLTCGIIDDAMAKLQRQLDLLMEHRQALITAAVTGELEIPKAA